MSFQAPESPRIPKNADSDEVCIDHLGFSRRDWLWLFLLVGMVVVVFWRLALTNLIIGRGDLFFYFYPYRDYASQAVRAGRVPLWNPYLFMGVPFMANSQAGFFYPLNLALAWLPVERMVNASIVIHAALAAIGAYLWGRSRLGLRGPGAWLVGVCYGVGGYFVAQVEHLNQLQALAWLPWLLWLYEGWLPLGGFVIPRAVRTVILAAGLGLVIALELLAGHMQSVFICLVGLIGYALLPVMWEVVCGRAVWHDLVRPLGIVLGASLLGAALAAVQLLPTLELSQLSVRSGGLPYKEAVSFSLRPELLGRALLPSWGASLFPEFIAYVGVVGLGLAALGVLVEWRNARATRPIVEGQKACYLASRQRYLARRGAVVLVVLGLFLALGGYNPIYILLVKLVPGFGSFRAPARWLALYAIGIAGWAGIGLDWVVTLAESTSTGRTLLFSPPRWRTFWLGLILGGGILAGSALLGSLLGTDNGADLAPPLRFWSAAGWFVAALCFGIVTYFGLQSSRFGPAHLLVAFLVLLVAIELLAASFFLPINRATAPEALTSLRPPVAHLLAEADASSSGAPDRFLSISDIYFDPGDKPEIETILRPQLSDDALYDYIIATKQKEVLVPNLPLYYRLPAMDGYDGGVLPLQRYVTLERLFMPEERVAIDGRLRENLEDVPDGRWLSLFNVRFIITDKVRDAWFDDVFYDLQMGAALNAGDEVSVGYVPSLPATALGVVYRADGAAEGTPLALVDVTFADGQKVALPLLADAVEKGERVARLSWGQAHTPAEVRVRGAWQTGQAIVRGLSLIDERTGVFLPLILSDSGLYRLVHSGDVKIYENLEVLPRLFFVPQARTVPDDEAVLRAMRDADFDPSTTAIFVQHTSNNPESQVVDSKSQGTDRARAELALYEPEHIVASVSAPTDGWLLLTDAWYPGWEATVDSEPVPVERADILFRAVAVPAGEHEVEWVFRPASFRLGAVISFCALGLLLVGIAWVALNTAACWPS